MGDERDAGEHPGKLTVYRCPACQGPLWETEEGKFVRYRCRVGHSYSADLLVAEMDENLKHALWMAARALEDGAALQRQLAAKAQASNLPTTITHDETAEAHAESAGTIRELLKRGK